MKNLPNFTNLADLFTFFDTSATQYSPVAISGAFWQLSQTLTNPGENEIALWEFRAWHQDV